MKFIKLTVIFISLVFIITSCSKTNNEGKLIPKNALAVVHLNTKSLSSKLSWNEIKQTTWFKEIYSDTSIKSWTKKLMDSPDSTGIDFNSGLILFMQKATGTEGQIVLEGEIKDEKDFESFNKNLSKKNAVTKDGDINILALQEEAVVGWKDKKFAYVINAPGLTYKMNNNIDTVANTRLADAQSLTMVCKNIFALTSDNSMAKIDKFSSLLKEEGDVHVWQNTEEIAKSSTQLGALSMLKLDFLLKGNISTFTGSFDNGKINVKQKWYASPELTDVIKKYFGGKINTDMIKNIPSQNIDGLFTLHFKPEGIKELIKLTGMDGFINVFLAEKNITIDDFVKANKGDIMFAVTDFVMKKDSVNLGDEADKSNNFTYEKPTASFLFSAGIGDIPSFNKLLEAGKKAGGDMLSSAGIFYANDDKFFAVGNSQQYVSKYIAGSDNKFDFIEKLENHPFGLFIDIQKILTTAALQLSKDSSSKVIMDESLKTWQNIYAMGGEYKDDGFLLNGEINFVDKNVNSLKQLNSYFDKIAQMMIEKNKKNKELWGEADSTFAHPPMEMDTMPANP